MFLKVESYKKGIVLSTIFNIANKGLVFLSSIIVAYYFGTQLKTDIYFYAYNTILILSAFITSLNASVLIPESMRLRLQKGDMAAMQFLNFFFLLYIILAIFICLVFLINPVEAFNKVSGFQKESLQQQANILLLACPLIFLIPIVNLLTDILTSYKFFSIPMIVGIVNGVFSILFIIIFHGLLDVLSILTGLLLSYALNFILLLFLMKKRLHWHFSFRLVAVGKRIWKNIAFAQAGNITTSLSTYAPLYILSGFQAGIITSLTFAQQIASIPTTIITNQFSSVAGIKFNELYAKKEFSEVNRVFLSTSSFLLFILTPVSGIFFLYSSQVTSFLLERGAFEKTGVAYTSLFLQYLGLLLPMLAINTFVARLFMAGQKIMEAFAYQIAFNCFLILFIFIGVQRFGIIGYPVAMVSLHILNVLICYFLLYFFFPEIRYGNILIVFLKILFLNFLLFIAVMFLKNFFINIPVFLNMVAGCTVYLLTLLVVNRYLKLNPEINEVLDKVIDYVYLPKANRKKTE